MLMQHGQDPQICPENRKLWKGINSADSIVFNLQVVGAQFDCSPIS